MDKKKIYVEKWVSWEEAETMKAPQVGGLGGFYNSPMDSEEMTTWEDYDDTGDQHLQALREEILRKGIRCGGLWHQGAADGVPVFSDGAVGMFSMRAWGDLLAATWSAREGKPYSYCEFAWD